VILDQCVSQWPGGGTKRCLATALDTRRLVSKTNQITHAVCIVWRRILAHGRILLYTNEDLKTPVSFHNTEMLRQTTTENSLVATTDVR